MNRREVSGYSIIPRRTCSLVKSWMKWRPGGSCRYKFVIAQERCTMAQVLPGIWAKVVNGNSWTTYLVGVLGLILCVTGNESAQATTGVGPYTVPQVVDINADPSIVETYIVADEATVNLGNGVTAHAMTFKSCGNPADSSTCSTTGTIPGPEFRLKVGNQVIVHFVNNLNSSGLTPEANVSGIHWHGIELNNQSDGSELTQAAVPPAGGTFLYKFIVKRPGIFWYHPHHRSSTNQVAKGLYGSIIVEDNHGYEATLIRQGVIPSAAQTKTLVISDLTVCGTLGGNPP